MYFDYFLSPSLYEVDSVLVLINYVTFLRTNSHIFDVVIVKCMTAGSGLKMAATKFGMAGF